MSTHRRPLALRHPGWAALLALVFAVSCRGESSAVEVSGGQPAESPAECVSLWEAEAAASFAQALERAGEPGEPVWASYDGSQAAVALYAGEAGPGVHCLGLWRAGRAEAYGVTAEAPKLLTPLYGYHLSQTGTGGPFDPLLEPAAQPASVAEWLDGSGAEDAVVMPVVIEGLPFEISTLQKVQIALHEGFHVHVQAPRWLGGTGEWPVWDLQPDRPGVAACYADTPEIEAAFAEERAALTGLVEALLDGEAAPACSAGTAFLEMREARYALLERLEVARHDGSAGGCREAEAIMELEEGTADYVSWPVLVERGLATREDLLARYRAQQRDVFYLTGAMQLHAVALMDAEGMIRRTESIAASTSPDRGSITQALRDAMSEFCGEAVPGS